MNKTMLKNLTTWVDELKKLAEEDVPILVSWFKDADLDNTSFSIVGGWSEGFSADYADLLYLNKIDSSYAMCVKIVSSDKNLYADIDFDLLKMPVFEDGTIDNTCIALELTDDSEKVAMFYLNELERINKEHVKELV